MPSSGPGAGMCRWLWSLQLPLRHPSTMACGFPALGNSQTHTNRAVFCRGHGISRKKLAKHNALLPKGCNLLGADSAERRHGEPCVQPGSVGSPSLAALQGSSHEGPHLPPEDPASLAAPASVCFVNQHRKQESASKDIGKGWSTELEDLCWN